MTDKRKAYREAAVWKVCLTGNMKPVLLIESILAMKASLPKAEENEDDCDVDDHHESRLHNSIQDSESDDHMFFDADLGEDEESSSDSEDDIHVNREFGGVGFSSV